MTRLVSRLLKSIFRANKRFKDNLKVEVLFIYSLSKFEKNCKTSFRMYILKKREMLFLLCQKEKSIQTSLLSIQIYKYEKA